MSTLNGGPEDNGFSVTEGDGVTKVDGGGGTDSLHYDLSAVTERLDLVLFNSLGFFLSGYQPQLDQFESIERETILLGSGDDLIESQTGLDGIQFDIDGGAGHDRFQYRVRSNLDMTFSVDTATNIAHMNANGTLRNFESYDVRSYDPDANDDITTGNGNDTIFLGGGTNVGHGGGGADYLSTGSTAFGGNAPAAFASSTMYGEGGDDIFYVEAGSAQIYGGEGNDSFGALFGFMTAPLTFAQTGAAQYRVTGGGVLVNADSIEDYVTFRGGSGADTVSIALGGVSSVFDGGGGRDRLVIDWSSTTKAVTGGPYFGYQGLIGDGHSVSWAGFEELTLKLGSGDDVFGLVMPAADVAFADRTNVVLDAGGGTDTIGLSGLREAYVLATQGSNTFVLQGANSVLLENVEFIRFADGRLDLATGEFNLAPIISSNGGGGTALVSVLAGATAVTTVAAKDPEGLGITFAISGDDDALFKIDAKSGVLTFLSGHPYGPYDDTDHDGAYEVLVSASDGEVADTQALSVYIAQGAGAGNIDHVSLDAIPEGDSGTHYATITLHRSAPDSAPLPEATVHYQTGDAGPSGATPGVDFAAVDGTATFAAGETTTSFQIPIYGDLLPEADEPIAFELRDPSAGLTIAGGASAAYSVAIANDDAIIPTNGTSGPDTLGGTRGNDILLGLGGDDRLSGSLGDDRLDGGAGKNLLLGGAGADTFVFAIAKPAGDHDQVKDFVSGVDVIELASSAFAALAGYGLGTLDAGELAYGAKARTADQHLIYDHTKGHLLYDVDGAGGAAAVIIAAFSNHAHIAASDIVIV